MSRGTKYKSGDSRKGTSLALPLRCMRATEYLGGPLRPLGVAVLAGREVRLQGGCGMGLAKCKDVRYFFILFYTDWMRGRNKDK